MVVVVVFVFFFVFLLQDEFSNMVALDGVSLTKNCAYESAKIRIFRAASIDAGNALQVSFTLLYPSLPKTQSSTWTKQHLPDQTQLPTL
jgi:hypothetical protein